MLFHEWKKLTQTIKLNLSLPDFTVVISSQFRTKQFMMCKNESVRLDHFRGQMKGLALLYRGLTTAPPSGQTRIQTVVTDDKSLLL